MADFEVNQTKNSVSQWELLSRGTSWAVEIRRVSWGPI